MDFHYLLLLQSVTKTVLFPLKIQVGKKSQKSKNVNLNLEYFQKLLKFHCLLNPLNTGEKYHPVLTKV